MRRLSRPLAFTAGTVLTVGAVVLAAAPGQAQTPELVKLQFTGESLDYIALDTTEDEVRTGDQEPGQGQALSVGCGVDPLINADDPLLPLLVITPEGGDLGYGKNGIGVAGDKDKNGTRCADVDDEYGQSLTVGLPGAITVADIDFEFKGGSDLVWTAKNGDTVVDTNAAGESTGKVIVTGLPGDVADNGPDAKDGDNYRVVFRAVDEDSYFDTLVLRPTDGGAFSLEGGGDGTAPSTLVPSTSASVFVTTPLDDFILTCDVPYELLDGNGDYDGVTVQYSGDCTPGTSFVPFSLERDANDENLVIFQIPNSANNAYWVTIDWKPEPTEYPAPGSKVYYYENSAGDLVEADLGACSGTESDPVVPVTADYDPTLDGTQGFCVVSQSMVIDGEDGAGNDVMRVTEKLFGVGDPAFGYN